MHGEVGCFFSECFVGMLFYLNQKVHYILDVNRTCRLASLLQSPDRNSYSNPNSTIILLLRSGSGSVCTLIFIHRKSFSPYFLPRTFSYFNIFFLFLSMDPADFLSILFIKFTPYHINSFFSVTRRCICLGVLMDAGKGQLFSEN